MWRTNSKNQKMVRDVDILARIELVCRMEISVDGVLRILLLGPTLRHEHLHFVLDQIASAEHVAEVVFDFGSIDAIEGHWTAVVAELILMSRRTGAPCHLESLHGQPADVFGLYLRTSELRSIMRGPCCSEIRRLVSPLRKAG